MAKSPRISRKALTAASDTAARAIPPVWPLASSVAVNPFLGQTGETLATVGARLGRISRTAVTMPRAWYAAKLADGSLTDEDLTAAIAASCVDTLTAKDLKKATDVQPAKPAPLPTVADLAAEVSNTDWPSIIADRFGAWAAGYFDEGQALWAAPKGRGAYAAWRDVATHDLTPEICGLRGFGQFVDDAPETAADAVARSVATLGLTTASLETYLHQALLTLGGWAQVARYKLWEAELAAGADDTLTDFIAIRLLWEEALYSQLEEQFTEQWANAIKAHAAPVSATDDFVIDALLQEALERATQRDLAQTFAAPADVAKEDRPALQAVFCIDVRSEVFRRALEATSPDVQTLGFAGFFGLTAAHKGFASDFVEKRLPVLLNPGIASVSGDISSVDADQNARLKARAKRAWGRFKLAAVSSFAFVEATGPIYAGKLVKDALNLSPNVVSGDPAPRLDPALDLETRIGAANSVLRAMSLTKNFARLVVIAGHGANVVNNPHASSLHCGACGGYSGEVNARLLAGLLNDKDVRAGLVEKGVDIPADTHFVGALHDTTTDALTLYDKDQSSSAHVKDIKQAKAWFAAAGKLTRAERSHRLPRASGDKDIAIRARDWAETRPEWALAGCKAFVAAPRKRTSGKSLAGRVFLHDYDWKQDDGFGVLELIMTAPVVVASWISLQYYGSTVAPNLFGSGNKLLHNVTGGIGVVEGNGGILRAGLPLQSLHDGEHRIHEPLRLSVCIEAPREAMTDILRRHDGVRDLFDNRWLYLFAQDEEGRMAFRYEGNLEWSEVDLPVVEEVRLDLAS
ncbi:MAG: DUF2309 domain-containing protein [Boseongicola sp.]|nr:DUF2309 domain-containing protein [Boseongicola sp.]